MTLSRVVFLAALFLVSLQTSGFGLAVDTVCVEHCDDDDPEGNCAPTCEDCLCCAHGRVTPAGRAGAVAPLVRTGVRVDSPAQTAPDSPEPADIFRVPKPARA